MGDHVFVSYARSDGRYVGELVSYLHARGIEVRSDDVVDYGDEWLSVVQENLDGCTAFVVVMSTAAEESEWVRREVLRALAKEMTIGFPQSHATGSRSQKNAASLYYTAHSFSVLL